MHISASVNVPSVTRGHRGQLEVGAIVHGVCEHVDADECKNGGERGTTKSRVSQKLRTNHRPKSLNDAHIRLLQSHKSPIVSEACKSSSHWLERRVVPQIKQFPDNWPGQWMSTPDILCRRVTHTCFVVINPNKYSYKFDELRRPPLLHNFVRTTRHAPGV